MDFILQHRERNFNLPKKIFVFYSSSSLFCQQRQWYYYILVNFHRKSYQTRNRQVMRISYTTSIECFKTQHQPITTKFVFAKLLLFHQQIQTFTYFLQLWLTPSFDEQLLKFLRRGNSKMFKTYEGVNILLPKSALTIYNIEL